MTVPPPPPPPPPVTELTFGYFDNLHEHAARITVGWPRVRQCIAERAPIMAWRTEATGHERQLSVYHALQCARLAVAERDTGRRILSLCYSDNHHDAIFEHPTLNPYFVWSYHDAFSVDEYAAERLMLQVHALARLVLPRSLRKRLTRHVLPDVAAGARWAMPSRVLRHWVADVHEHARRALAAWFDTTTSRDHNADAKRSKKH